MGTTLVPLFPMVIVSGLLQASGETVTRGILRFLRRLAGERGGNSGILAGVPLVGFLALGVIGPFIGLVLLAVTWTLLAAWVGDLDRAPPAPGNDPGRFFTPGVQERTLSEEGGGP